MQITFLLALVSWIKVLNYPYLDIPLTIITRLLAKVEKEKLFNEAFAELNCVLLTKTSFPITLALWEDKVAAQ